MYYRVLLNAVAAQMLFLWLSFTCKGIIVLETELEPTQRQSIATAGRQNVDPYI